jgi:ribosomal protein L32
MRGIVKSVVQSVLRTESMLQKLFLPPTMPAFQLSFDGWTSANEHWKPEHNQNADSTGKETGISNDAFGGLFEQSIWNMGVPKSKVSPGRKRMAWKQHHPKVVEWTRCEKCGEPKRPHRMCSKNADVCAMRPEEYQDYLSSNPGKKDA